jgi:hypothetical protein
MYPQMPQPFQQPFQPLQFQNFPAMAQNTTGGQNGGDVTTAQSVDFNKIFSMTDFMCPITGKPIISLVEAKPCGHYFDEQALIGWFALQGRSICYICKKPVEGYSKNSFLDNKIRTIQAILNSRVPTVQNNNNNNNNLCPTHGAHCPNPTPDQVRFQPPLLHSQQQQPQQLQQWQPQQQQQQQQQPQQLQQWPPQQQQQQLPQWPLQLPQQPRLVQPATFGFVTLPKPITNGPLPTKRKLDDELQVAEGANKRPNFGPQFPIAFTQSNLTNVVFRNFCTKMPKLGAFTRGLTEEIARCTDEAGNSLFHYVVKKVGRSTDGYFKALLEKNGDINHRNNEGDTPLHLAIKLDKKTTAIHLVNVGARTDIPDNDGVLPLRLTSGKGWSKLRELIKGVGSQPAANEEKSVSSGDDQQDEVSGADAKSRSEESQ